MLYTIIIFILILSLLVFVHEIGHFVAAKKMGVKVEEFGFGLPPKIFGIKKGETTYSINWLPIGGFVRLKGENGGAKADKDSFGYKKPWQKAIILVSGVAMNFVLAFIIISLGLTLGYPQIIEENNIEKFAKIKNEQIQILAIMENSPAEELGIPLGAIIDNIDGIVFENTEEIQDYINEKGGEKILLGLKLEESLVMKELLPMEVTNDLKDIVRENQSYIMGASLIKTGVVRYPFYVAPYKGAEMTLSLTKEIIVAFYSLIRNLLFTGKASVPLTGPVGIAILTDQIAHMGFIYLLQFIAILSINLGIINIFPFPALDGGRLLFLGIAKLKGKAVDEGTENLAHNIGFLILILLIVVITYKDVRTYQSMFVDFFKRIF
ncbi:RIP metalloprotease [Patescibacteria group bacterium]